MRAPLLLLGVNVQTRTRESKKRTRRGNAPAGQVAHDGRNGVHENRLDLVARKPLQQGLLVHFVAPERQHAVRDLSQQRPRHALVQARQPERIRLFHLHASLWKYIFHVSTNDFLYKKVDGGGRGEVRQKARTWIYDEEKKERAAGDALYPGSKHRYTHAP